MGVLNVTPDSFSDGGRYFAPALAEKQALRLQDEGAHFLDIGGESSRPGSRPVSAREEIRRVVPVLKRLRKKIKIPVSVDTTKSEVAHAALDEGAAIINDITALADKRMAPLIARYGASVVLMHMQGSPRDMQKKPRYRAVLKEVKAHLKRSMQKALDAGIERTKIAVDPGFFQRRGLLFRPRAGGKTGVKIAGRRCAFSGYRRGILASRFPARAGA